MISTADTEPPPETKPPIKPFLSYIVSGCWFGLTDQIKDHNLLDSKVTVTSSSVFFFFFFLPERLKMKTETPDNVRPTQRAAAGLTDTQSI